jgi:hypothetical protein
MESQPVKGNGKGLGTTEFQINKKEIKEKSNGRSEKVTRQHVEHDKDRQHRGRDSRSRQRYGEYGCKHESCPGEGRLQRKESEREGEQHAKGQRKETGEYTGSH